MYTVVCDSCGKDANEGGEYSCWNDKQQAVYSAKESGFIEHDGKHLCEDCWRYDDNDEMQIISK